MKFVYAGGKPAEPFGDFKIMPSDCSNIKVSKEKDCYEGLDQSALAMEGSFYLEKTYPLLLLFKTRFGKYPAKLDSLTALDSVDYSYLERAWKLNYESTNRGESFELQKRTEAEIAALVGRIQMARGELQKRIHECEGSNDFRSGNKHLFRQ